LGLLTQDRGLFVSSSGSGFIRPAERMKAVRRSANRVGSLSARDRIY
jgi:hypothetical protein